MYTALLTGDVIMVAIALSHSHVVACTSKGYVRVYTTQGTPVRLYRQKHAGRNVCELEELCHGGGKWRCSWQWYYIRRVGLIVGTTELTYSIEDVLNDEMVQSGDTVALPPGGHLKSVFFSEEGVRPVESWLMIGSCDI
jgi:chromosome transmission fidelity protein 4